MPVDLRSASIVRRIAEKVGSVLEIDLFYLESGYAKAVG